MYSIHKFPLRIIPGPNKFMWDKRAKPLWVLLQGYDLFVYAHVPTISAPWSQHDLMEVTITLYGTGNVVPEFPGKYLNSVQTPGNEVWHAFDSTVRSSDD